MKEMTKEDREKAIDAFTDNLNEQMKKAIDFRADTNFDRRYGGIIDMSVYTTVTTTLTYVTKRPMYDDELQRLAEGRL